MKRFTPPHALLPTRWLSGRFPRRLRRAGQNNLALAAAFVLGGTLLVALLEFFMAFRAGAWQYFAGGALVAVLVVEALYALQLSRRSQEDKGLVLLFLTGPAVFILHAALFSGIGLALALGILAVVVTGPPVITPRRSTGWMIFLGIASGFLTLLVDNLDAAWRLPAPAYLEEVILAAVVAIVLLNILLLVRQFGDLSLNTKLLLVIVAIVSLSTAAVAFLSVNRTRQSLLEIARQNLASAASQAADEIIDYLTSNLVTVEREAALPVFGEYLAAPPEDRSPIRLAEIATLLNSLASQENELDPILAGQDTTQAYLLLDKDGRLIASTAAEPDVDFSDQAYYLQAVEQDRPVVSALKITGLPGGAVQESVHFSAPVKQYGRLVGVLVMRSDARALQTLLQASNAAAGEGSYGLLVDEHQIRLAHGLSPDLLYTTVTPLSRLFATGLQADGLLPPGDVEQFHTNIPELEAGLRSAARLPDFTFDDPASGERYLASSIPVTHTPWLLAYVQPEASLLDPVEAQTRWIEILALGIAGLAALAAGGLARGLSLPIQRLTQAAQQVSAGDLSARAPVEAEDEVGQLAQSFNRMTGRIQALIANLEERVRERTLELERRSRFLEGSVQVGKAAVSLLDPQELIKTSVDLIREHFGLYYVGLFLSDEPGEWAVLRAGTGAAGEAMLRRGHRLKIDENSMIGWCITNSSARVALEASEDQVRMVAPELPETRSEAAIPLRSRGRILGALSVQSIQPRAFDDQALAVFQTMADQLAVALDNARLYTASQESLESIRRVSAATTRQAWSELLSASGPVGYVSSEQGVLPAGETGQPGAARPEDPEGDREPGSRGEPLSIPITVRGQVVGALDTYKPGQEGSWEEDEISLLQSLAEQLGVALDTARLYQESRRRAERERLAAEITARLRSSNDPKTILQTAVTELRQALNARQGQVLVKTLADPAAPAEASQDRPAAGDGQDHGTPGNGKS